LPGIGHRNGEFAHGTTACVNNVTRLADLIVSSASANAVATSATWLWQSKLVKRSAIASDSSPSLVMKRK
jgi:hypothetical protein